MATDRLNQPVAGMQPLKRSDIKIGTPLPWPVYDSQGSLLLKKGYVVRSQAQLDRLFERGLHLPGQGGGRHHEHSRDTANPKSSPFAEQPSLVESLRVLLALEAEPDDLRKRLLAVIQRIGTLCERDPDACLALVHLQALAPSPYEQALSHAILCQFIARELDLGDNQRTLLIAAALLANLALVPFQAKLNRAPQPLNEQQRQVVNRHPQLACDALRKAGLAQQRLLQVVAQHHERFDGSGYPEGLRGEAILIEARILGLVERYTSMVTQRAYRKRWSFHEARDLICISAAEDPDQSIYEALFDALGDYPPGSFVRLHSGETAVVTRPGTHTAQAILNPSGEPYMGGMRRDTATADYAIESIVVPESVPPLQLSALWGYG